MQRREFMQSIAASIAALGVLPQAAHAATNALDRLRRQIGTADDALWQTIRKSFIIKPGLTHLNCGSLGACPQLVVDGVAQFMRELEQDPVHQTWGPLGRAAEIVRAQAAAFIGAAPDEVAITNSTTAGMNAIASGLRLEPGDEILTTNHEHHGGLSCWEFLARRDGVRIVQIKMPVPLTHADLFLSLVEKHLTPRTRVCSFCHIDTLTGAQLPIQAIAKLLRARKILLVCDGAQAPGMLKVNVKQLGVDAYASSSHKWMLAPKGSGLLYIRAATQDRIQPIDLRSGFGVYTGSTGTRNIPQILGHGLAMDFHNTIGRANVEARCRELCAGVRKALAKFDWLESITPEPPTLTSAIVSFKLLRGSSNLLVNELRARHNIAIKGLPPTHSVDPSVPSENYNAIRISTHVFNDEADIARLAEALADV